MKIQLDLTNHCIETELKKIYHRTISDYFKKNPDRKSLETQLEMITSALSSFDFGGLRTGYPPLRGHSEAKVYLYLDESDIVSILIDNVRIEPSE